MQRPVRNLPGSADLIGAAARETFGLEALLSDTIAGWGYQEVRTPVIEDADLFLRKSGGELAARLYRVDDPGGARAALRPELTASTIRAFIGLDERLALPVRWRYGGPVFRHRATAEGPGLNQATQIGAELIGSSSHLSDAEIVIVACEGIRRAGIQGASIRYGHLGVVESLLQAFGLSDRAELFLLTRLASLRGRTDVADTVLEEARLLRLTADETDRAATASLSVLEPAQARTVVHQMVAPFGPAWVGSRNMEDVEGRLLEKLRSAEDPAKLKAAVTLLAELASTTGEAAVVMTAAGAVLRDHGLDPSLLDPARELADFLSGASELVGIDQIWDFGFAPGLAYYTGLVFELTHPTQPEWALGGGGRYDGLIRALGGPDLPALGFAYTVEAVQSARAATDDAAKGPSAAAVEAVIVPRRLADSAAALAEAGRLRGPDGAKTVVIYPEPGEIDAAEQYAVNIGARAFVMVGPDGPHSVSLEDLSS